METGQLVLQGWTEFGLHSFYVCCESGTLSSEGNKKVSKKYPCSLFCQGAETGCSSVSRKLSSCGMRAKVLDDRVWGALLQDCPQSAGGLPGGGSLSCTLTLKKRLRLRGREHSDKGIEPRSRAGGRLDTAPGICSARGEVVDDAVPIGWSAGEVLVCHWEQLMKSVEEHDMMLFAFRKK